MNKRENKRGDSNNIKKFKMNVSYQKLKKKKNLIHKNIISNTIYINCEDVLPNLTSKKTKWHRTWKNKIK